MKSKILSVKAYEQSTFLTCLSACFMMARDFIGEKIPFNQEKELEMYNDALKSVKDFYHFGFLKNALEQGYKANMVVEIPTIFEYLKSLNKKVENKINCLFKHISIDIIKETLEKEKVPIIVLVDQFPISLYCRTQHYVLVFGYDEKNIHIVEPWYGQKMKIPYNRFQEMLDSLRNNLFCGTQMIYLKKENENTK